MFRQGHLSARFRAVSGAAGALAATIVLTTGTASASQPAPSSVAQVGGAAVHLLHGGSPVQVSCSTVAELNCADKPKRGGRGGRGGGKRR